MQGLKSGRILKTFVIEHCQPRGKTIQKDGGSHVELYLLDPVFMGTWAKLEDANTGGSLLDTFKIALRKTWVTYEPVLGKSLKQFKPVCSTSIKACVKFDFSTSRLDNGRKVQSN